ncbi:MULTISPECIES: hypothetical protein [Burkholderiaceae]|uniref:hypothetical protein n=1 Tax=Burkholderiaceae TaxID=119060 RepID=UPI00076B058C|nr:MULTISPECIES: hypothetical protein [Burkholderiaceae]AMH43516.1 hypothetical protein AXG89_38110 [Burkholderia sp. PAMC 26561]
MPSEFTVGLSNNAALHAQNSYFIASGNEVFLRFHGDWAKPTLMTATAGEHSGRYASVCADQGRLLFSAALVMEEQGRDWEIMEDNEANRPYIKLHSGDSAKSIFLLANRFFNFYNQIPPRCDFDITKQKEFVQNTYGLLTAKLGDRERKSAKKVKSLGPEENPYIVKLDFSSLIIRDASSKQKN